jgi:hypothetical protein
VTSAQRLGEVSETLISNHFLSDAFATGIAGQDNGFARFDHVRVPRTNMFSKFAEVTEEGGYIQPPHAKLSYGGVRFFIYSDIGIADWVCQMMYIRAKSDRSHQCLFDMTNDMF